MKTARKNDINVAIRLTVKDETDTVVDLSSATTLQIKITKPDSTTVVTKTATLVTDGTDGKIQYLTVDGDLNQLGIYEVQAFVVIGASQLNSDILKFRVTKVNS